MKKTIFMALFAVIGQTVYAQIDSLAILKKALLEGEKMENAFLKDNYDVFVNFSHPKILEMAGGKDKMVEMLSKHDEVKEVKDMLIDTELSLPSKLIIQDSIYQCVVSQKQIMNFDGQKYFTLSSLLAISYNKGENWFFISGTKSLAKIQTLFPELSDELEVIEQTLPMPYIE